MSDSGAYETLSNRIYGRISLTLCMHWGFMYTLFSPLASPSVFVSYPFSFVKTSFLQKMGLLELGFVQVSCIEDFVFCLYFICVKLRDENGARKSARKHETLKKVHAGSSFWVHGSEP